MRRVRSQLNNLVSQPAGVSTQAGWVQPPVGSNRETDEIQRRINAMGIEPAHAPAGLMANPQVTQMMHQGAQMQNQAQYAHHNQQAAYPDPYAPQQQMAAPHAQHMPQAPVTNPAMQPLPQGYVPAPQTQSPELGNIKASLDRLTSKLLTMSQSQTAAPAQSAPAPQDTAMLTRQYEHITAEMAELKNRLGSLANPNMNNDAVNAIKQAVDANYHALVGQIKAAEAKQVDPAAYAAAVESSHAELAGQVGALQSAIGALNAAPADLARSFESGHAEITAQVNALYSAIDAMNSAPNAVAKTIEDSHAELAAQVDALRASMDASNGAPDKLIKTFEESTESMTQRIDALHQSLNIAVGAPGACLDAVENSHRDLASQLDTLRKTAGVSGSGGGTIDMSALESRLEEITRAIVALSSSSNGPGMDNLERIEARVSDIAKMMDNLPESGGSGFDPAGMLNQFDGVNAALKEIDTRISGFSPMQEANLDGMAAQINKLSEKLDNISIVSGGSEGAAVGADGALLSRLDQLVERVEAIKSEPADLTALHAVENQMGTLSAEIDSLRGGFTQIHDHSENLSSTMMQQLEQMAGAIDQISAPTGDSAAQFASLEQQISSIAGQLNSVDTGTGSISLDPITERLTGIEEQLGASRDIAIELATQAAEEAVTRTIQEMPKGDGSVPESMNPDVINSLSEDLRKLHESSANVNTNSVQIFGTVKDTLSMMAERLNEIEIGINNQRQNGANTAPVGFVQTSDAVQQAPAPEMPVELPAPVEAPQAMMAEAAAPQPEPVLAPPAVAAPVMPEPSIEETRAYPPYSPDSELPQTETPDLAMDSVPEVPSEIPPIADDVPLEPGTGGPDLAALVRQANERRKSTVAHEGAYSGTEFFAAARRAAQAASAEANMLQEEIEKQEMTKSKKSLFSSMPELFAKRKKVIIIAAAAALLVAIAVPLAAKFFGGGTPEVAVNNTPAAIEQSAIQEETPAIISEDPLVEVAEQNVDVLEPLDTTISSDTGEAVQLGNAASVEEKLFVTSPTAEPQAFEAAVVEPQVELADLPFGTDALKLAVANQEAAALFEVGRRYTEGSGVERNLEEAAKWYEQSASLGFAPAQYIIGNFNEKGLGVEKNAVQAATWYELAARNGNVISMHNLAVLHATPGGLSEAPNMDEAFTWFKQAAEHGVRDSQVNVGIFYTNGAGQTQSDLVEAYKWFAVAAKAGDKDAGSKRDIIADAMRPDQFEQAKIAADEWKPVTINKAANDAGVQDVWKENTPVASAPAAPITKVTVAQAQAMLTKLGFDAGPADGLMGKKTREAIMAFQQKVGMPVSGNIDAELIKELQAVSI